MGMRATRSDDTVLEGAFVPDKSIARVLPAGAAGADMFVLGFFTWALVNFANIYYAIGLRTREVLIEQLKTKTSIALTRPMIYHPEVQHHVAEMRFALETIDAVLNQITSDWSTGVDHGMDWPAKILSASRTFRFSGSGR